MILLMWKTSVEFFCYKTHSSHPWTSTTNFFAETASAFSFLCTFSETFYESKWIYVCIYEWIYTDVCIYVMYIQIYIDVYMYITPNFI